MTNTLISIAKQFSRTPAGRFKSDGPKSGEAFRDTILIPSLQKNAKITVDLNGALGFGSSFLEEAFGGLVRKGFSAEELNNRLVIKSGLSTYSNRIWKYISDAEQQKTNNRVTI